jgi:hypothetical protein
VIETKAEIGFVKNEIRTSIILFNINLRFCDNFSTIADLIQQKQVKTSRRFLSYWGTPLSLSDIRGSGGAPPRVSRKGKAPPLERGRGRHSSLANPGRVTARASEQRDNGVHLSKT